MFVLATGIGHCGTKWLASVLNRPGFGVSFGHELKMKAMHKNWRELIQHEEKHGVDADFYKVYFDLIKKRKGLARVVGDSNSWTPTRIPEVDGIMKVDLAVYLLRNGIQQVHSRNRRKNLLGSWWYDGFLKRHWDMLGSGPEWDRWNWWEKECWWWKASVILADWLTIQLPNRVITFKLEDLTKSRSMFRHLISRLGIEMTDEVIEHYQKMDVNRKVKGDRRPETIWKLWTRKQSNAFKQICGETMKGIGYEMP